MSLKVEYNLDASSMYVFIHNCHAYRGSTLQVHSEIQCIEDWHQTRAFVWIGMCTVSAAVHTAIMAKLLQLLVKLSFVNVSLTNSYMTG
jgi:hypothetical protein